MSIRLPSLEIEEFLYRLEEALQAELSRVVGERLWIHYEELRRWSSGLSLIGRGTADKVIERHYAESLAAVPLIEGATSIADLGSGAGFPGWVLSAASPGLAMCLVESRHRKALFLEAAARKASLSCVVLNARVGSSLPEGFPEALDLFTVRAVRLSPAEWSALVPRLGKMGRILRWVGPSAPAPPEGFVIGRRVLFHDSQRAVEELVREEPQELNR